MDNEQTYTVTFSWIVEDVQATSYEMARTRAINELYEMLDDDNFIVDPDDMVVSVRRMY